MSNNGINIPSLDARLLSVAGYIREGACVADIGTDHAYLPIWLVLTGKAVNAVASDIGEGPVARAKVSVVRYGVEEKITVIRADGLCGIKDLPVTDIVIAGMGGELIANIISAAEWVRDPKYRLVLQPMTHPEILRRELLASGFFIIDETLTSSTDGQKLYVTVCVEYSGEDMSAEWSDAELLFGKHNIDRGGKLFDALCQKIEKQYEEIKLAKESAGQNAEYENEILDFLNEREQRKESEI